MGEKGHTFGIVAKLALEMALSDSKLCYDIALPVTTALSPLCIAARGYLFDNEIHKFNVTWVDLY